MKTKYIRLIIVSLSLSLFTFFGCSDDVSDGKEGIIHFELTYIDGENSNPIITFLPNTMTYAFKNGQTIQKVEGWGGVFKMIGMSDTKKDSVTALMKILGEKFKYQCRLGEDSFGYEPLEGCKIKYVNGTKEIAGYKCKRAIATYKDQKFELYYTEDIKIENANWNTPFKDVKGVLLEYQISMFKINTKIVATKVDKIKVDDSEFDIPNDYTSVKKEKIEETVYKFM